MTTYDAFERLRARTLTNQTPATLNGATHYVWDIFGNIIAEMNGSTGAALRETVYLEGMPLSAIDAAAAPKKIYAIHTDHLHRPVLMTDAAKSTVWQATWEPYGRIFSITGSATQNLGLPGQWFQLETGLNYNWHRHYDPSLGRFLSPDPLGFVDGPALYAYAGGVPHLAVDEDGLFWQQALFWGAGGFTSDTASQIFLEGRFGCIDWRRAGWSGLYGAIGGVVGANTLGRMREPWIGGRRVAPFGNWTPNANRAVSKWPHCHKSVPNPHGPGGMRGQGINNHRPWEGGFR